MYSLEFNTTAFEPQFSGLGDSSKVSKAVKYALSKVALQFKKDVTPHVPRGTGELLNSYKVESKDLTLEMGFDIIYAMYQEQGMRRDGTYIIRNRPAGGKTHFTKETIEDGADKYLKMFENEFYKKWLTT